MLVTLVHLSPTRQPSQAKLFRLTSGNVARVWGPMVLPVGHDLDCGPRNAAASGDMLVMHITVCHVFLVTT
ncbi:hypothetical protein FIBSPDRAFT_965989 [Athelia psychrophila]|uniref:Uncharacterized protein n=1 Tax=Athelia psychrophila TaxID=1759441 RepID=A0A167XAJ8_9AGAM|nr:hypothetical protein FIBSPDRAFT_965989 [Fibularhizoctonia sp. CBS 109695]